MKKLFLLGALLLCVFQGYAQNTLLTYQVSISEYNSKTGKWSEHEIFPTQMEVLIRKGQIIPKDEKGSLYILSLQSKKYNYNDGEGYTQYDAIDEEGRKCTVLTGDPVRNTIVIAVMYPKWSIVYYIKVQ